MRLYPPWETVAAEAASHFQAELERELHASHCLYGVNVRSIAKVGGTDDVAFALADGRVAVVHLTYSKEATPNYPLTTVYPDYLDWYQSAVMAEFYQLLGLQEAPSPFTKLLIDVMLGYVGLAEFESWLYRSEGVADELGEPLYLELISHNFNTITGVAEVLNGWFDSKIAPHGRNLYDIAQSLAPLATLHTQEVGS